ncbi:TMEM165/GDT1 family protein [Rhodococcus sp. NPDC019627]|uniref:TMEM165/GDT1 family protein n=1 Tax=unclassified Rhodococcus (in: high G+C Gram-positive bacteria) TaxID=192944 RepID=UPI0033D385D3
MLAAVLLSFGVIFVAELGDKSQLMAMTFALRYRWWVVISGITVATTVVHLVSVAVGHSLGVALPTGAISVVGGVAFLIFGAWTLRGDRLTDEEQLKAGRTARSAFLAVTSAFFLAELGDKTMLATITLATDHDTVGVWIGSTVGMVAADALAILLGAVLGKHLPERVIRIGAAVSFFAFGAWLLLAGLLPGSAAGPLAAGAVVVTAVAVAAGRTVWSRRRTHAPVKDQELLH